MSFSVGDFLDTNGFGASSDATFCPSAVPAATSASTTGNAKKNRCMETTLCVERGKSEPVRPSCGPILHQAAVACQAETEPVGRSRVKKKMLAVRFRSTENQKL